MGERLIVCGGGELREFSPPYRENARRIALEDAHVLCAAKGSLFAACGPHDMIWRMDSDRLVPTGLFAGGPGVCSLICSPDGRRLYALCAEADTLLMLDAESGAPLIVNRVGVNPAAMAMDESGQYLAVAGGASGDVLLLSAKTLALHGRWQTPGVTLAVGMAGARLWALSLDENMDTVFTAIGSGGRQTAQTLRGMPGTLLFREGAVLAATHRGIWRMDPDGKCVRCEGGVPGRASRLLFSEGGLLITDLWSDTLYIRRKGCGGRWTPLTAEARDAILL